MKISRCALIVFALVLAPSLLVAQDVTGLWDITAGFSFESGQETLAPPPDCEYEGFGISLVESNGVVTGTVDLTLTTQPSGNCPGEIISGDLVAALRGTTFTGTLTGSKLLGTADVTGTILTPAPRSSAAAAAMTTMSGTALVSGGSFPGSGGSFSGQQLPAMPTLSPSAIALMTLILFGGTILLLLRRDRAAA